MSEVSYYLCCNNECIYFNSWTEASNYCWIHNIDIDNIKRR